LDNSDGSERRIGTSIEEGLGHKEDKLGTIPAVFYTGSAVVSLLRGFKIIPKLITRKRETPSWAQKSLGGSYSEDM